MSSVSSALAAGQAQIAVARQQLKAIEQEGRNAITLIKSSAAAEVVAAARPDNVSAGVAQHINFTA